MRARNLEQGLRVFCFGQCDDGRTLAFNPFKDGRNAFFIAGIKQQVGRLVPDYAVQRTSASRKYAFGEPKGGEKFTLRFSANSWDER